MQRGEDSHFCRKRKRARNPFRFRSIARIRMEIPYPSSDINIQIWVKSIRMDSIAGGNFERIFWQFSAETKQLFRLISNWRFDVMTPRAPKGNYKVKEVPHSLFISIRRSIHKNSSRIDWRDGTSNSTMNEWNAIPGLCWSANLAAEMAKDVVNNITEIATRTYNYTNTLDELMHLYSIFIVKC